MSFSHSVVSEDWDQSMQNISGVSEFNQGQRKYLRCFGVKEKEVRSFGRNGESKASLQTQIFLKRKLGYEFCFHAAPD